MYRVGTNPFTELDTRVITSGEASAMVGAVVRKVAVPSRSMRRAVTATVGAATGGTIVSETPTAPPMCCAEATQGSVTVMAITTSAQPLATRR